ncbi:PASTA domain-containing protein [Aquihabitans sp. G128]|nr:PASTA domain-containing protein [Aquihabitans sp. G128]
MGASAQVYLADDVRLRRRVALKMLHDALAGDAEFLRRFRAEARAAAALSHPNVMAVYDWGDDETAFIVTEYLGGGSLRALLDQGEVLSPSQALTIGLEATRALDYAHRRGFVHRDIKPANLLFGEEQRLRIADFGLARALAEAAWTEPQGALLGTARYASPEQAKGEKLSGKADVYSLALVLVEAVTGEVPFVADTTLGTLMARVDKQLEVPESLGPLREVLLRAGHPDPEQRIDARGLATGLLRAAKALPKPALLPLAGALSPSGEVQADADPTVHGPVGAAEVAAAAAAEADLTAEDLDLAPPDWVNQPEAPVDDVAPAAHDAAVDGPDPTLDGDGDGDDDGDPGDGQAEAELDDDDAHVPVVPVADLDGIDELPAAGAGPAWSDAPAPEPEPVDRVVDPDATVSLPLAERPAPAIAAAATVAVAPPLVLDPEGPDGPDGPAGSDDDEPERRRRRRWPWVVLVLVLLAAGGGTAAAVTLGKDDPKPPTRTIVLPVPTLTGRSQDTAESVAEAAGWKTTVKLERRDGTLKGTVLGTTPAAGTRLARNGSIELLVSAGQTEVAVPQDLPGKSLEDATAELEGLGLKAATKDAQYSEDVADGAVIALGDETPAKLEKGLAVPLVVSKGPEPRTVPGGLVGSSQAKATAALEALQLKVAINSTFSDTVPEGEVMAQSPGPGGTLPRGGTVTLQVSKGPELVAVPDVSKADTPAEAAAIIRQAGLVPGDVSGSADGKPTTSPAKGTKVKKGSTVKIVLK